MSEIKVKMIDENNEKEVTGGTDIQFTSGYCPWTPERVCRVDPIGGWNPESERCTGCYWRESAKK